MILGKYIFYVDHYGMKQNRILKNSPSIHKVNKFSTEMVSIFIRRKSRRISLHNLKKLLKYWIPLWVWKMSCCHFHQGNPQRPHIRANIIATCSLWVYPLGLKQATKMKLVQCTALNQSHLVAVSDTIYSPATESEPSGCNQSIHYICNSPFQLKFNTKK